MMCVVASPAAAASFGRKQGAPVAITDDAVRPHFPPAPRIFCFAVLMPIPAEIALTEALQSSFEVCDGSAIISNVSSLTLDSGVVVPTIAAVEGSMDVIKGGEFHTALNTPIFNQMYARLFSEKTWAKLKFDSYDWIIKMDADTVLVPDRLHTALRMRNPLMPAVLSGQGALMRRRGPGTQTPSLGPGELNAEDLAAIHVTTVQGPLMPVSIAAWRWLRKTYTEICVPGVPDWQGEMGEDWFMGECCKLISIPLYFDVALIHEAVHAHADPAIECNNWQIAAFHGTAFKAGANGEGVANRRLCLDVAMKAEQRRIQHFAAVRAKLEHDLGPQVVAALPEPAELPRYSRSSITYGLWFSKYHALGQEIIPREIDHSGPGHF